MQIPAPTATAYAGRFITLEGIEGVGKTTHLQTIQAYCEAQQIPYLVTREPGGTPIAEILRKVILTTHAETLTPTAELLLLFAGRAQHIAHTILPALHAGQWVICDRFTETSYAYQGEGRQLPLAWITALEQWVQGELQPDLTLLFDAPVAIALQRARQRNTTDRIEAETVEFFQRARDGFLKRAAAAPHRIKVLNTHEKNLSEIDAELRIILTQVLH